MEKVNVPTLLVGMLALVLAIVSFNLYVNAQKANQENEALREEVEKLTAAQTQEQALYTETEAFIQATLEGGAVRFFSERYEEEAMAEFGEAEDMHGSSRSRMEDFEIFNISVQPGDASHQVYAVYKVALTGVDGELQNPGEQPLLYLMSKIKWIEEEGQWKVDFHDLEPLASGEEFEEAITNR